MTVAAYLRVSTENQTLDRQRQATADYAADELGAELADLQHYTDKSTGTDTARDGYQQLMDDVEAGEIDAVVVHEMSRISRSLRDLKRTVDRLKDAQTELHFVSDPVTVRPGSDDPTDTLILDILAAVAEFEARITQQRVRQGIAARMESDEYHHGPAPLGYEKDDGRLIEGPEYEKVCEVLEMVRSGDLSKRKAARELDCARATINDAIRERGGLYGL